ncbi:MAG: ABC transporter permease [Magnetococcales bacterium]|nr:ABC transporter permease [Magnetococcales bacterium]
MTSTLVRMGAATLDVLQEMGRMAIFLLTVASLAFSPPFRPRNLLKQMHFIGNRSLFVIMLTATFAGMVLALQGFYTLSRFGAEAMLGPAVALTMIRELGPVLTGLMVTARAGSALTTELGIMRIREQLDAMKSMGINPMRYLVVPRIQAGILVVPLLTAVFDVIGIWGGYLVSVELLGMSSGTYFGNIETKVETMDIVTSLVKGLTFGLIITWVCTFMGYHAQRGAEGVGKATTGAVVMSSVLILVCDYFITAAML